MKLSNLLVAAAMVVGSASAMGCSTVQHAVDEATPSTADAPEASSFFVGFRERFGFGRARYASARPFVAVRSYGYRASYSPVYVRFAPPAARYEYIGRAPSSRHFWVNGYQKWNGREYLWVGGHWDTRRDGMTYVQPHYDVVDGRHRFIPGHWA